VKIHQPISLKLKKYFMKKGKVILIFVSVYILIGVSLYFLGGEVRGISFSERAVSLITVTLFWPFFLIGKIFWN
jgi:hypothetical protein